MVRHPHVHRSSGRRSGARRWAARQDRVIVGVVSDHPGVRIGTAERDRALQSLGKHFSEGRLDLTELEERSGHAATARTAGDLARVFADLPGGLPAAVAAPHDATRQARRPRPGGEFGGVLLVALVLLLVAVTLTGHGWLMFVFFPAAGAFRRHARHPHADH